MIILYATKLDTNGNIYKLKIDHARKIYTTNPAGFFHRSDAVTITRRQMREIIEEARAAGYTEKTF